MPSKCSSREVQSLRAPVAIVSSHKRTPLGLSMLLLLWYLIQPVVSQPDLSDSISSSVSLPPHPFRDIFTTSSAAISNTTNQDISDANTTSASPYIATSECFDLIVETVSKSSLCAQRVMHAYYPEHAPIPVVVHVSLSVVTHRNVVNPKCEIGTITDLYL